MHLISPSRKRGQISVAKLRAIEPPIDNSKFYDHSSPHCHHWSSPNPSATEVEWYFLRMPINIGDQIGDYEITGTLGRGGMGQVYQVRHTISHRIEAMKVLAPGRPVTDDTVGRFLREIQLLASLQHPNITA